MAAQRHEHPQRVTHLFLLSERRMKGGLDGRRPGGQVQELDSPKICRAARQEHARGDGADRATGLADGPDPQGLQPVTERAVRGRPGSGRKAQALVMRRVVVDDERLIGVRVVPVRKRSGPHEREEHQQQRKGPGSHQNVFSIAYRCGP